MSRPTVRRIPGKRIDLEDIEPAHFEQVITWRNDPENRRYFFSQHNWTLEGQLKWYERYRSDPTDLTFAILKSGLPVGMVALYAIDDDLGTAEFGRLLIGEKKYRRQGIAYEACQLCLDLAFADLSLQQVYLKVYDWNLAAIRLYERLGFVAVECTLLEQNGIRNQQKVHKMILACA
jgi:RimJ/RimL family protein N-acetyltransferase